MNKSEILQQIKLLAENELNKTKIFVPGVSPVHASGAVLFPEDIEELADTVLQFWYTDWIKCRKFRAELCKVTGKKHCVLTNSGSSASLIALTASLKQSQKKFVVTTALGFPTTVYPIYQNGEIPIFIDTDPKTLSPDWEQCDYVTRKYGKDIAGFVFAHTMGFPFFEPVLEDQIIYEIGHPAFCLVDCADALGAKYKTYSDEFIWNVGFVSDAMTLSFFPAHHICTGEGGAVLTNDYDLYKLMEKLVNWGRDCTCLPGVSNTCGRRFDGGWFGKEWKNLPKGWDHKYTFTEMGYNLKMTEFQAALGYSQLKHLDQFVEARRKNYYYLLDKLQPNYQELFNFVLIPGWSYPSPFGFPIMIKENVAFSTSDLINFLEKAKIHTRRFFGGNLTRQPVFENLPYIKKDLTGTDYLMENAFWVGVWSGLTKAHLDWIIESIYNFFKERKLI